MTDKMKMPNDFSPQMTPLDMFDMYTTLICLTILYYRERTADCIT